MTSLALERLEPRDLPATVFWNLNADGFWDVAANWRDDQGVHRVPTAVDDVVIDQPAALAVTLRSAAAVRSLTSREALIVLPGSLLTLAQTSHMEEADAPVTLQNFGTVRVQGGMLNLSGSGFTTGTFQVDAGGTLAFRQTHEFREGARLLGSGLVRMQGAAFHSFRVLDVLEVENFELASGNARVIGTLTVTRQMGWVSGQLDGPGTTAVPTGSTLLVTGGIAAKRVTLAHSLDLSGTMRVTGDAVNLDVLGTIRLHPNAALLVEVTTRLLLTPPGLGGTFQNHGRVEVARGTFDVGQRTGTSAGVWHAASEAQILLPRPHLFQDGTAFTGPGRKVMSGAVELQGAITGDNVHLNSRITGNHVLTGTFLWQSGSFSDGGETTLTAGGTLSVEGSTGPHLLDGGRTFFNEGTVALLSGATLEVPSGGAFTNAGGIVQVRPGSTLLLEVTYLQIAGTTRLETGIVFTPLLDLQGGTLEGTGAIFGDVRNASRLDVGGTGLAGALGILGNYTQTSSGTLGIEIGGLEAGSTYDYLTVDGAATLDGTLALGLLSGYVPGDGDVYQIIGCPAVSGDFAAFEGLMPTNDRSYYPYGDEVGYALWVYLL